MKIFINFMIIAMISGSCKSHKGTMADAETTSHEQATDTRDETLKSFDHLTVTYQALSRSSFEHISISQSKVVLSSDRYLLKTEEYPLSLECWNAINELVRTVDVEQLKHLKAPTDKRLYDGAPHATLAIVKDDLEYRTASFDHGFPPEEIEALVTKVLTIKEKVTKQ